MSQEEDQAKLLADWLAAPSGEAPPPGLDPEVAESVFALRPDRAPAPRIQLDDILAEVSTGPLAGNGFASASNEQGSGEVVAFPLAAQPAVSTPSTGVTVAPARRPWYRSWLAGGTASAIGLAAVALFAVRLGVQSPMPDRPLAGAPIQEQEAVGTFRGDAAAVRSEGAAAPEPTPAALPALPRGGAAQPMEVLEGEAEEAREAEADALGGEYLKAKRDANEGFLDERSIDTVVGGISEPIPEVASALGKDQSELQSGAGGSADRVSPPAAAPTPRPAPKSASETRSVARDALGPPPEPPPVVPDATSGLFDDESAELDPESEVDAPRRQRANEPVAEEARLEVMKPATRRAAEDLDVASTVEITASGASGSRGKPKGPKSKPSLGQKKEAASSPLDAPAPPPSEQPASDEAPERVLLVNPPANLRAQADVPAREDWRDQTPPITVEYVDAVRITAQQKAAMGDLVGAGDALMAVVQPPPACGQAQAILAAQYYLQASQTDRALAAIQAGLGLSTANTPRRSRLFVLLGDVRQAQGDPEGAREAYLQAIALNASREP